MNEYLFSPAAPFPRAHTVRPALHPHQRAAWLQEVVWLPSERARAYGPVEPLLSLALGTDVPAGHAPLMLHPQPPAAHRRLKAAFGAE